MRADEVVAASVLNVQDTLKRFGGDRSLLLEMAAILQEDTPNVLRELKTAVQSHDAQAIKSCAHALKGLVAGCGGERAAVAAQKLEDAGCQGVLEGITELYACVEDELRGFLAALAAYCGRSTTPA